MPDQVTCANCGTVLPDEDGSMPPEQRKPCPVCGSTARVFHVTATATIQLDSVVTAATVQRVSAATSLVLNAVVSFGEKTEEGHLITAVLLPWFDIIDFINQDPARVFQIPWRKWEEIIAGAYEHAGFDEVTLTPRSRDEGRDVIAVKRALGTVRIIDQVKAYGPGHLVTADEVRSLLGVLATEPASSKGFLTTTSGFAPTLRNDPLLAPFMPGRIELIDGPQLLRRLNELASLDRQIRAEENPKGAGS